MVIDRFFWDGFCLCAAIKDGDKTITGLVWSQAGQHYVSTGSTMDGTRARHFFSPVAEKALADFLESEA